MTWQVFRSFLGIVFISGSGYFVVSGRVTPCLGIGYSCVSHATNELLSNLPLIYMPGEHCPQTFWAQKHKYSFLFRT